MHYWSVIRDLKSEGASGFSYLVHRGKEIPDLSTQQQGTESILVNSEKSIICRFVLWVLILFQWLLDAKISGGVSLLYNRILLI